jgi:hypothetical protein
VEATAEGARDVGGGGNGGGDHARDAGRQGDAVGGRRDAHRGACERGASSRGQQPQTRWGRRAIGHEFEASGRQRTLWGAKKVAAATAR